MFRNSITLRCHAATLMSASASTNVRLHEFPIGSSRARFIEVCYCTAWNITNDCDTRTQTQTHTIFTTFSKIGKFTYQHSLKATYVFVVLIYECIDWRHMYIQNDGKRNAEYEAKNDCNATAQPRKQLQQKH